MCTCKEIVHDILCSKDLQCNTEKSPVKDTSAGEASGSGGN